MHPYLSLPTPHLFGHRGASGEIPENTLEAFERAWSQGVEYLETDCHATRDGEIVLCHDALLERTTDASGPIRARSYAELTRLDAGYRWSPDGRSFPFRGRGLRIPRLRELLATFPRARINLELKQAEPPMAEAVVKLVHEAGASERVLLAAGDPALLQSVRALRPGTAIGMSRNDVIDFVRVASQGRLEGYRAPGDALQIPPDAFGRPLVTRELLEAAHAAGLLVHVWTINDPARMRALLELGVDGLMSDHPARLLDVARSFAAARAPS